MRCPICLNESSATETLSAHLARGGKLTGAEAISIMLPILAELDLIHARNSLHLNVNPSNILIHPDGTAELVGMAEEGTAITEFSAWEQYYAQGKRGVGSEVYSCAATMYLMVTGVYPPPAIERLAEDHLVAIARLAPDLDKAIAVGIRRGLSLKMEERPRSIAEFKELLSTAGSDSEPDSQPDEVEEPAMNRYLRIAAESHGPDAAFANSGERKTAAELKRKKWQGLAAKIIILLIVGYFLWRGQ